MPRIRSVSLFLSCMAWAHAGSSDTNSIDAATFSAPPKEHHPETWFHFIGGNVAKPGITADLEAISGAGISGIQMFHGQFGGPWPGVEPQIQCLSGSWDDAVKHVGAECERLGLKFTMQNCPGWAMAGGPWITPDKAMRQLVWSRTDLTDGAGGTKLPQPETGGEDWRDYRDIAVIAFPTPDGDSGSALSPASVRSNRPDLPWERCLRGEHGGTVSLSPGGDPVWVEVSFPESITLRTVEFPCVQGYNHGWCYDPGVGITVEAVADGKGRQIASYEMPPGNWQESEPVSLACGEQASNIYRITIRNRHEMKLSSIRFHTAARMTNWQAEAAFDLRGLIGKPHPAQSKAAWIDPEGIVDLTDRMAGDGTLRWQAPAGKWTVMRWGHVNAGKRNGPAPAEATGWECDKLSASGAEAHFDGYIGRLTKPGGPLGDGRLKGMLMDSWECGRQTWTAGMDEQFGRLRGYPLRHWFPALAGYVVGDPEITRRFLRDWRATINDLTVRNFFGRMAELGRQQGLSVSYETAMGDVVPGDILEFYKHADVPMCEFWQPRGENYVGSFEFKPVKPCVSAARMYGKRRVAAEAFTSFNLTWNEHPGMLKDIANMHLAEGVTHLVFHTYTHHPRVDSPPPGTSFGASIGTPFLRGQTWWKHMPEFTDYLARCGWMLEAGRPVSDVLWYLGDELDHKPKQAAPFPAGYRYDYCNPDALLHRLSVKDGRWVTPEGLSYQILWLPDCPRMLPETLERMLELVKQGGILVGERPLGIATLSGGEAAQVRFRNAADALWGPRADLGAGRVIAGVPLELALKKLRIAPDFGAAGVAWNHRTDGRRDWYFVAAPADHGFKGALRFRATGAVTLWDPATGNSKPAGVSRRDGDASIVWLELAPSESRFVVFDTRGANSNNIMRIDHDGTVVADVSGGEKHPQVVSAFYGDPGDARRRMDVTDRVRQSLASGVTVIRGSNEWAGGDPAPKTVKRLWVELRMPDGQVRRLEASEGEPVALTDTEPLAPPLCEVLENGRLLAWEPGTYQVTRGDGVRPAMEARCPFGIPLERNWKLAFPEGWGNAGGVTMDRLVSWPDADLPQELKSFSGTATYTRQFDLKPLPENARVMLDLGRVEVIASVKVNGKNVGTLWAPPYRLDITNAVKTGANHVSVEVTNTWFNRLSHDAGLEESHRKTWTIAGPARGTPPSPAGLLGPVIVRVGLTLLEP